MPTRTLNVQITGDTRSLNSALDQTESRTKKWSGRVAAAGLAAGAGLAIGLKKSAGAAIEAEKAQKRMEAQLKASGISYKAHADQIDKVIQKQSQLSGLDDEDLTDSFTNLVRVTGDVNKSLKLNETAMDLARAKHIDVAKAGEIVGKVAGGNTGILSRYGIKIKEGATATEALGEMHQKFAGQAEAYGKTTAGAGDRASVAWENLQETLGEAVLPMLAKVGDALADVLNWMQRNEGVTKALIGTIAAFVGVLGSVMIATKVAAALSAVRAAVVAVNVAMRANPIGLVITALALLATGLVVAYKKSETFRKIVDGAFAAVKGAAKAVAGAVTDAVGWVKRAFENAVKWVSGAIRDIKHAISSAKDAIGRAARSVADTAMDGFAFIKKLPGRIGGWVLDGIQAIGRLERRGFNAAVDFAKKIISGVGSFLRDLPGKILGWFKDGIDVIGRLERRGFNAAGKLGEKIISGLVHALGALAGAIKRAVIDNVRKGVDAAAGAVSDIIGKVNPFGDGIGRAAKNIAGDGLGFLGGSAGGSGAGLRGADFDLAPFARIGAGMGLSVTSGLRPGSITSSGNQSYHSSGDAIDMAGPPGAMMRFFRTMKGMFGNRLRELIYTPGGVGVKDGRPFTYSGQVAQDHYDHVHVAYTGPFGDGIGQIRNLWTRAGGSAAKANMAAAIAMAESSGDPHAFNRNTDGSVDRGLWQINSVHGALSTFDRMANARAAVRISGNGRNWNPWVTFKTGAYRRFLSSGGGGGGSSHGPSSHPMSAADRFRQSQDNADDRSAAAIRNARHASGRPLTLQEIAARKAVQKGGGSPFDTDTGGEAGGGEDPNQAVVDALNANTEAVKQHQAALDAVGGELKRQSDLAAAAATSSEFQLRKMLAEVLSGQIGRGIVGRAFSPGDGIEYAW